MTKLLFTLIALFTISLSKAQTDTNDSKHSVQQSGPGVDAGNTVAFTIDTRNTKLKFGKSAIGMLIYTVDGRVPTKSNDKTSFMVGLALTNDQTIDKKLTATTRIKRMPYTNLKIDENKIKEIEIGGISGYEIVGEGLHKSGGAKELIYQVMLFTEDGYYILVGTTENNYEQNLELFRKVARTLKRA